jgi:adenylate kinase
VAASGLLTHFSNFGLTAKIKLVIVGSTASIIESVNSQLSSLNIEHVSPADLIQREISRRTPLGQKAGAAARRNQPSADETTFAVMRRWFWTRKPDVGFVLTDFPATLLQAKVFDEWLDARDEALDIVVDATGPAATNARGVIQHYREQGLLLETADLTAPFAA